MDKKKFLLTLLIFILFSLQIILASGSCARCGNYLTDTFWEDNGNYYCDSCYQSIALRCAGCGQIISGKYYIQNEASYCEVCYEEIAPKCKICNVKLEGEYITSLDGASKFCKNCSNTYPACSDCGVPMGNRGINLDDGRHICSDCSMVAINTEEGIKEIFEEVKKEMKNSLAIEVTFPIDSVKLVNKTKLDEIYSNQNVEYSPKEGVSGIHYYEKVNGKLTKSEIYVLDYLTPKRAWGVISHEYTHAWQAENCPDWQDLKVREGFAEWVSYKILQSKGYDLAASAKLETEDPVYGGGLREMLEIEKRDGISGVISYARSSPGKEDEHLTPGMTVEKITEISQTDIEEVGKNLKSVFASISLENSPLLLFILIALLSILLLLIFISLSGKRQNKSEENDRGEDLN